MNGNIEINEVCRLCLTKERVHINIFDENGMDEVHLDLKISTCLPVQISRNDDFPKTICHSCSDKVNSMFIFWNTTANSEKKLFEWFQRRGPGPAIVEPIASDMEVELIEVGEKELCKSTTDAEEIFVHELPYLNTLEIVSEEPLDESSSTSTSIIYESQEENLVPPSEFSNEKISDASELETVASEGAVNTHFQCIVPTCDGKITNKKNIFHPLPEHDETRKISDASELETVVSEGAVNTHFQCIVPTCDGKKTNKKNIFHPLPEHDETRKVWLDLIRRPDLREKPYHDLRYARVCSGHFDSSQYIDNVSQQDNNSKAKKCISSCIVPHCDGRTKNVRLTFHSLPSDDQLRDKWLTILNRQDLKGIMFIKLKKKKVCSAHFAPSQYRSPISECLNPNSIPLANDNEQEPTTNTTTVPPVTPTKRPNSHRECSTLLTPKVTNLRTGKKYKTNK